MKWTVLSMVVAAVTCAAAADAPQPAPAETVTISVLATTDIHGHLEALPWISGYVQNVRAARAADGDVLLLDAGDMWQGGLETNLTEGAAGVRAFNALGYAAAAIGNHEFDFGPVGPNPVPRNQGDNPTEALERRAAEARFPFLSANIVRRDGTPWTPPNIRPSTLVTVAGVRVGLIGLSTIHTPAATDARNLVNLRLTPLKQAVEREAARLRRDGATVIVVLAHAGGRCETFDRPEDTSSCQQGAEIFQLARALTPGTVDMIAAGHHHEGIAHRVNGIPIVESYRDGRAFSRVDLTVDRRTGTVRASRIHPPQPVCNGRTVVAIPAWDPTACSPPEYEGAPVRYDRAIATLLEPDIEQARRFRQQTLGVTAPRRYWHTSRGESPASNFVVDLLRASWPGADVAIYNATGTRAELLPGPITWGAMHALVPFDSVVTTATLTARELGDALLGALASFRATAISGFEADVVCEAGRPRITLSRNGRPLPPDSRLTLVTSEFVSTGPSGYFPKLQDRFEVHLDVVMRDALVKTLPSQADAVATGAVGGYEENKPRIRLPGPLPVRCR